jgi:hypothetical protein
MKNKFSFVSGILILLISILGCSSYNPLAGDSNTMTNQAIESTVGGTTTGVVECDQLLNALAEQSKNADEDFITKGARELVLNRIRESVRQNIEENKTDKAAMARNCSEYRKQLDNFKSADNTNKTEKN